MDIIFELLVAVILGALGLATPLNQKLKKVLGAGIIELLKPSYEPPKPEPVFIPTLDDFMLGLGAYTLVEQEAFEKAKELHPPRIPDVKLGTGSGKAAMVVIHTLSSGTLIISVRWPSGTYYFMENQSK